MVLVPVPNATHKLPFHAMPIPLVENMLVPSPVQLIPSEEYAIVFVPVPTATHKLPFHATFSAEVENTLIPRPVQLIPSGDVAIEFGVPLPPTATNKLPFQAMPLPTTPNVAPP
jgi:hypothetical protein